jgi:ribosomal-protein-serine acetyltransferase
MPVRMIDAGSGILLRVVSSGDLQAWYAAIDRNRTHLQKWLPWANDFFGPADLRAFLDERLREHAERSGLTTLIWKNGDICGSIGMHRIDEPNRSTSIGYWLDRTHEGQGIMTRACSAMITEAFRNYRLHRVEIRCATGNVKSCAIPRRLGLLEEGLLRDAEWLHDHWVDLRVFSVLENEWRGASAL